MGPENPQSNLAEARPIFYQRYFQGPAPICPHIWGKYPAWPSHTKLLHSLYSDISALSRPSSILFFSSGSRQFYLKNKKTQPAIQHLNNQLGYVFLFNYRTREALKTSVILTGIVSTPDVRGYHTSMDSAA